MSKSEVSETSLFIKVTFSKDNITSHFYTLKIVLLRKCHKYLNLNILLNPEIIYMVVHHQCSFLRLAYILSLSYEYFK